LLEWGTPTLKNAGKTQISGYSWKILIPEPLGVIAYRDMG
jgi:hypothetical protein